MGMTDSDSTGEFSEEAIKWCRENAPIAIKDLADDELWYYMKDSYMTMGVTEVNNPNVKFEIDGITISISEDEAYIIVSIYKSGYLKQLEQYNVLKCNRNKKLKDYYIKDLGSGTNKAGDKFISFVIIEEDNRMSGELHIENAVIVRANGTCESFTNKWNGTENIWYKYSDEEQCFVKK